MSRGDKKDYRSATFRLPPELLEMLDRCSRETGISKSFLVKVALEVHLLGFKSNQE